MDVCHEQVHVAETQFLLRSMYLTMQMSNLRICHCAGGSRLRNLRGGGGG